MILPLDRTTGRPRGFAFVEFESEEEAARAIETLDGKELTGRQLKVSEARERVPRLPSMGGPPPFDPRRRPFKSKGSRRGIRARKRSL